jgi:hypothetical protein
MSNIEMIELLDLELTEVEQSEESIAEQGCCSCS